MIMAQQYVNRFNTVERVLHWIVAVSFFVLLLSGLGLFSRSFFSYFALFGGPEHGILFHKGAGIVFLVSSVLLFIPFSRQMLHFDEDDRKWLAACGGYLSRKGKEIPQGKFNAGQKIFGIFAFVATLVMGATGLVIWNAATLERTVTRFSFMFHGLFFVLFMMGVIVHIYLGSIGNPGTMEGMLWGQVRRIWARKHHLKWYRDVSK
jgi:formate dehydrogenase subunit gamma